MTIANVVCISFKQEILDGLHSSSDVYKIALYTSSAILNENTTSYTTVGETSGVAYTPGGIVLSGYNKMTDGTSVILDWADPIWTNSSFTAAGALIYNTSKSNRAVCCISFGTSKTSLNGEFKVVFPPPTSSSGLIVIS